MPNNWMAPAWATNYAFQQQQALDQRTQNTKAEVNSTIDAWQPTTLAQLENGYNAGRGSYAEARGLYDPYVTAGQKALGTYQDSLGLNGASGNANAVSAFQASPGYAWQRDQAIDGVARKASALGALGSGNTEAAIADRASNLANQEYGGWQDRLNGLSQLGYSATGAQAGLTRGIGDLDVAEGKDRASVLQTGTAQKVGAITGLEGLANQGFQNMTNSTLQAGLGAFKNEHDDSVRNSEFLPNLLIGLGSSASRLGGAAISKWG